MGLVELRIFPRQTTGKNANRRTRAGGRIPAVLYGSGKETSNVEVDTNEFTRAMAALGGSSVIFSLKQETSEDAIALLRDVQRNPVTDSILHLDLFEIPRGVLITAPVRVMLEGESLAVKRGDAVLSQTLDSVEVSCLPRELPEAITLDVTDLELGDRVYTKELQSPAGEITTDPETLVVLLKAPTVFVEEEEEVEEVEGEAAAEGEAEGEAPEGEGKEDQAKDADSKGKGSDS